MIEKIAQKLLDDRGELFGPGMYGLDTIRAAVEIVSGFAVQYIQYNWDNARQGVTDFYSYTPREWDGGDLLPNLQCIRVYGREVNRAEFEAYIKDEVQPAGAAFSS